VASLRRRRQRHGSPATWLGAVKDASRTVEPVELSGGDIQRFFDQGFLIVDRMSSPEELAIMRSIYDRLFEERVGLKDGLYTVAPSDGSAGDGVPFPKIHRIFELAPELCATGFMTNAACVAQQLFGPDVMFLGGRAMFKPPFCTQSTPWHQDPAYHRPQLVYRNVNVWLALQDCPADAGAMQFVPGSHRGSLVQAHRRPGDDPDAHGLELVDPRCIGDVVACPLSAGGVTLHHSYMLHHTAANTTAIPRRALIAVFGMPPTERSHPLDLPWQEHAPARDPGT
jgi:hypothetical protein